MRSLRGSKALRVGGWGGVVVVGGSCLENVELTPLVGDGIASHVRPKYLQCPTFDNWNCLICHFLDKGLKKSN